MWRKHDFARLRGKTPAELRLLVEAVLWLGLARSAVLTIPFRWTARLFALHPAEGDIAVDASVHGAARPIGWAVRAAASRCPWKSTCLAQALAGSAMLRRRRIPGTIAMGVAKSSEKPGALEAHAWLSCGSVILTGAESHERFNVVARYTPVRLTLQGHGIN